MFFSALKSDLQTRSNGNNRLSTYKLTYAVHQNLEIGRYEFKDSVCNLVSGIPGT